MPSKTKTALAALFILGPVSVVVLAGPNNRIDDRGSVRAVSVPMSTGRTGVVNHAAPVLTNSCRAFAVNIGINAVRARSPSANSQMGASPCPSSI